MSSPKKSNCTIDDIYALPEGERAELINGELYMMAPPGRMHQRISTRLSSVIDQYISDHSGSCEVYSAPFAVFLNADDKNYVEPDISVICDKDKLTDKGCNGAPDWIIEIVSPASTALSRPSVSVHLRDSISVSQIFCSKSSPGTLPDC